MCMQAGGRTADRGGPRGSWKGHAFTARHPHDPTPCAAHPSGWLPVLTLLLVQQLVLVLENCAGTWNCAGARACAGT